MKPPLRSARISARRNARSRFSFALFVFSFAVLFEPLYSQTTSQQEKTMKHYALLFHTSRTLTPEEQKQRGVEIAAWVKQVTDMGITLDPHSLGETAATFSADGSKIVSRNGSIDPSLSNIVFFDSSSKDQAVDIARMHPGLHYGVTVEVREWTSPRQTAASQASARP
jgi:hypothetical protein